MKLPDIFEILTLMLIALIAYSWISVIFNGSSSGPASWGERYENIR